jgi:hypothetical protein
VPQNNISSSSHEKSQKQVSALKKSKHKHLLLHRTNNGSCFTQSVPRMPENDDVAANVSFVFGMFQKLLHSDGGFK